MEPLKYIIVKKQFTVTVVSDLRKVIPSKKKKKRKKRKVIPKQTPPSNKRRIGNVENLIKAAAFNRINTVICVCLFLQGFYSPVSENIGIDI